MNYSLRALVLMLLVFTSCSDDDNTIAVDDGDTTDDVVQLTLEEQRDATVLLLTADSQKVWRIESAKLTNTSGDFDISDNFNVRDDEFIFGSDLSLEWKIRNDIRISGTTAQETQTDYYRSSLLSTFEFDTDSATEITSASGLLTFTAGGLTGLTAVVSYDTGEILELELTPKTAADYPLPPGPGDVLNFTEVFSFVDGSRVIRGTSSGMIGSSAENSVYVAFRDNNPSSGAPNAERIIKYDLDASTSFESYFDQSDFISKRLQIIDDELIVFGGQFVNTYPLDLSGAPTTIAHGDPTLTRFGYAVSDAVNYVVGGNLEDETMADKIYTWDGLAMSEYATLPDTKFHGGSQVVDNKLYIFGGVPNWLEPELSPSDDILVYDLTTGLLTDTFAMTQAVHRTFTGRVENLIYVAGQVIEDDGAGTIVDISNYLGVFNTLDNSFTEFTSDLDESGDQQTIYDMALFNGKMYVIYGTPLEGTDTSDQMWSVMATSIE